jgi:hypothetical protein
VWARKAKFQGKNCLAMPQPFYLIAHNPNTVGDAISCLATGANALEPDVLFKDNDFYVMEMVPIWSKLFAPRKGPRLADYLKGLQGKITASQTTAQPLRLKHIFFDTKNLAQCPINQLYDVIRANFTLPGVTFSITTGNKKLLPGFDGFVLKATGDTPGIDGGCTAKEADLFFQRLKMNYTYANGTSLPLVSTISTGYFMEIMTAIQLRDNGNAVKPSLVYAWTVNSKDSMRAYLSLGVDGFITDKIGNALSVLSEPEFVGKFSLD